MVGGYRIILDIRAVLDDGSRADVEMQIRAPPLLRSRLVYYGARDYSGQLARGEGSVRARIEAATIEQLEAWAERVLTVGSLEEVLDESLD